MPWGFTPTPYTPLTNYPEAMRPMLAEIQAVQQADIARGPQHTTLKRLTGAALTIVAGAASPFLRVATQLALERPTETRMSAFQDVYTGNGGGSWPQVIGQLGTAYLESRQPRAMQVGAPGIGLGLGLGGAALAMLPALGGAVVRGGAAIARSAMTYCRRNPAWCASIGGTAAIAGLIESGSLPTIRRRRGRGITPRDLRSFRRVAGIIKNYCPTVRRLPSRAVHVRRTGISHAR